MLIYTKCLTFGYEGKDHLINVKPTDTLLSFKEKIMSLFKVDSNIDVFDDKTERTLNFEDSDLLIRDAFQKDSFYSVSFAKS
jgi:hypothetical protein